jgi:hypothetical protein
MTQPAGRCRRCAHPSRAAAGLCRRCYDRERRNAIHFGGFRDQVLERDRACRLCVAGERLVVHHRQPGLNRPDLQITLCRRCHLRVHRRQGLPGFYSDLFLRLWCEIHPDLPVQLRLPLAA